MNVRAPSSKKTLARKYDVHSPGDTEVIYANTYRKDDLSWRAIIFLPFDTSWRVSLALAGVLYFNIIIYENIFSKDIAYTGYKVIHQLLGLITMVFCIDVILSILHKTWEGVQRSMPYPPKTSFELLIDVISVIPLKLLSNASFFNRSHGINWIQIFGMNGCLRVYRIFVELGDLRQRKGMNSIILVIMQTNVISLGVVSVMCSIYYVVGFVNMASKTSIDNTTSLTSDETSWLEDVRVSLDLDLSRPFDVYEFTFIHIYVLLSNEVVADVRQVSHLEALFLCLVLYYGFVMRYGFTMSNTINGFLQCDKHMYGMKNYISINLTCLKGKKEKEVRNYYNTFWSSWSGLHKCPLLGKLPLCLRKDVLTDVYWDAMTHSHVLRHFTINIKRELSLVMESKFLQPGQYLFRKGEAKDNYYYIASGVVQIMSHYDGVSPIMTISGGSSLGSLALLMRSSSSTDVICATVCEVRILAYRHFYDVLKRYPNSRTILADIAVESFGLAKKMYVLNKSFKEENIIMKLYGVPQDDKLKWIKRRWRTINTLEELVTDLNYKTVKSLEEDELKISVTHTSKRLDVIVLSNEAKWEADKCCIKSRWPYVLDPDCNFVKVWLAFICVMIIIDCFVVPYRAAFLTRTTDAHIMWDHIICFAYLFDVYFQAITGVRSVDKTIMEPMPLLRHHLKSPKFLLDIVGAIPTREVLRLYVAESDIKPEITLIRLCKSVRIFSLIKYRYSLIMSNFLMTHIAKYLYIYVSVLFVCACISFMNSCMYSFKEKAVVCKNSSWYLMATDLGKMYVPIDDMEKEKTAQSILDQAFLDSVQFVFRYILKTGLKYFAPTSMKDVIMCALFVFISNNLLIITAAEIIAMQLLTKQRGWACNELISELKFVLTKKNAHLGLLNILDSFLSLQWKVNGAVEQKLDETPCSEIISPVLEVEQQKIILNCLKKLEFFTMVSETTFANICKSFRLFTVPEDFIFCRSGDQPSSFNIILKGYCNLTSMLKEDVFNYPQGKVIGPGFSFPLMEVAQNIPCLQTTVSVTVCKVAAIDVIEFRTLLNQDETMPNDIKRATDLNLSDLDIVVSKKKYSKWTRKTPSFVPRKTRWPEMRKGGTKLQLIMDYLPYVWKPPFFIHPNGKFMMLWETIQVANIFLGILYFPLLYAVTCNSEKYHRFAVLVLSDTIALTDLFIRFNVGHYSSNGVLLHKPSHYFYNAFITDLVASFPTQSIGMFEDYSFKFKFVFSTMTTSLQIYRIWGYFKAIHKKYEVGSFVIVCFSFFVYWCLFVSIFANWLFINACEVTCAGGNYTVSCVKDSCLFGNDLFAEPLGPHMLLMFSYFLIITSFVGNDQTAFLLPEDARTSEMFILVVCGSFSAVAKFIYICIATSVLVGGYVNFTKHRENMKLYWFFVRNEGGSEEVASTIASHVTVQYSKLKGIRINEFVYTLHPSLQSDLTFAIYYKSMVCLHHFVGNSTWLMKRLTKKVDEIYYQRNTTVLQINEVNDKIFFVRQGVIDVLNKDSDCIKSFGPGSMFGSFKLLGKTRHQFEFRSRSQSNLIFIGSNVFYAILRDYGKHYEKKFMKRTKNVECFIYKHAKFTENIIGFKNISASVEEMEGIGKEITSFFYRDRAWYKWGMFFLSMIIPYVTVFPLLQSIIIHDTGHTFYVSLVYILDIVSSLRIVLACMSTYRDEKTGVYIHNLVHIRIKYIMTPSQLMLDLLSIFPYEMVGYIVNQSVHSLLRINRMLKLLIMIRYIRNHSDKIYVRPSFRWFEFIALVTLVPYTLICFWQYTTCIDGCSIMSKYQKVTVRDPYIMFIYSSRQVINLYTFSPAYDSGKPWTGTECLVMMIISVVSFLTIPLIISRFAKTSQMANYTRNVFDYNVQCMKVYLQLRDLSQSLLETLWNYLFFMWKSEKGEILPRYIKNAPPNMKSKLMYDLYGAHIKYNILFEDCEDEFIVQLSGRLKRFIYFPGDFIIRKFDVDDRMYFINSGEVEAIDFDELFKEIVKEVYITGQCFGLRQGLYERVTHMASYKTRSMVEMLTLEKGDWEDLAQAFPEENVNIFKIAKKISLDNLSFMVGID